MSCIGLRVREMAAGGAGSYRRCSNCHSTHKGAGFGVATLRGGEVGRKAVLLGSPGSTSDKGCTSS